MKISENIAQGFVISLKEKISFKYARVTYELQDDWQFILIVIHGLVGGGREDILAFLRSAQEMADESLPWRHGHYTWMINIVGDEGEVVESVFGGDLDCPQSGRI